MSSAAGGNASAPVAIAGSNLIRLLAIDMKALSQLWLGDAAHLRVNSPESALLQLDRVNSPLAPTSDSITFPSSSQTRLIPDGAAPPDCRVFFAFFLLALDELALADWALSAGAARDEGPPVGGGIAEVYHRVRIKLRERSDMSVSDLTSHRGETQWNLL